jgi:hypothetical protein
VEYEKYSLYPELFAAATVSSLTKLVITRPFAAFGTIEAVVAVEVPPAPALAD